MEFNLTQEEITRTCRFLLYKGAHPEEADDLTQRTMLKAWANRNQFLGHSELQTWLNSIAFNELRMAKRPTKESRATHSTILDAMNVETPGPTSFDLVELSEKRAVLYRAVAQIPWRLREATLGLLQGEDAHGLKRRFHISEAAAKSRRRRGVREVMRRLGIAFDNHGRVW